MILIDGHNIISGGGLTLLNYFIRTLEQRGIPFILIKKTKAEVQGNPGHFVNCDNSFHRSRILKQEITRIKPNVLFCLGNYPPSQRFQVPTVTYLHNVYLVDWWPKLIRIDRLLPLRQRYIRHHLRNTDYMIFQNEYVRNKFIKLYGHPDKVIYESIPFFDSGKIAEAQSLRIQKQDRFIYVSLPHKHKNHDFLMRVWTELLKRGCYPQLLLTIPHVRSNHRLLTQIDKINSKGGNITNLGSLSYEETLRETAGSRFCIFPSLRETFGLGLVEAAFLGCKILTARLPYVNEIIKPSLYFNSNDVGSGVTSVLQALQNEITLTDAVPVVQNRIDDLLDLLEDPKRLKSDAIGIQIEN